MDLLTATTRLQRMTQYSEDPVLTDAEITDLLFMFRRPDQYGYVPYADWAASTVYTVNSIRVPTVNNGHIYYATTAGTSGSVQPTWPTTSGGTVTDGSVVWTERGQYLWTATWDLRAAAAEGWRWKAGKVASKYDAATGNGTDFKRSQQHAMCMQMAASFGGGRIGSVKLQVPSAPRWRDE